MDTLPGKNTVNSGIYMWRNKATGRVLVGQTQDFQERFYGYVGKLRRNVYGSQHFQRSWNKHGEKNFEFIVLERIENLNFLTSYEQSYLDYYRTLPGGVYNEVGPVDSPFRGAKHTLEARGKISAGNKGRIFTNEHRSNISKAQIGKVYSQEYKDNMSDATMGKIVTDETRKKISDALTGKIRPPEVIEKMRKASTGKKQSPETIEKRVSKIRGRPNLKRSKRIERIHPITGEVKEYRSGSSVQEDGFSPQNVSACANGKQKTHAGFFWQFIKENSHGL